MTKQRVVDRIIARLGRRGAILTLLAFVFLLIGLKALISPSDDGGRFMIYTLLPAWGRGIMWLVPAVCGIFAAMLQKGKNDGVGFAALCIPAAVMTGSYLVSFLAFLFGLTDFSTGWVNALEWGSILAVLVITSGWAEVEREVTYISLPDEEVK